MIEQTDSVSQDQLIESILLYVPREGWSITALKLGAADNNMRFEILDEIFPEGSRDALRYFSHWADRKMVDAVAVTDLSGLHISERISFATETRFAILEPYREAVRRAMSLLMLPSNVLLATKLLYNTVDQIWYETGDRSADFSFYTKRGILAGVIGSTTLFWMTDDSANRVETKDFLDRRLNDVMNLHKTRKNFQNASVRARMTFETIGGVLKKRYESPANGNSRVT